MDYVEKRDDKHFLFYIRWFGFEGNASDKAETNIQIAVIL